MSTVQDIEAAISQLSEGDRAKLRDWFANLDHDEWDKQIADDEATGRLDALADEGLRDLRELARDLPPSVIHPAELKTPEERAAAFLKWADSHAHVKTVADDSRESIYEGRGE